MKKLFSLIKASMTENMSLFNVKVNNKNSNTKKYLPIIFFVLILYTMSSYADMLMSELDKVNMAFLTIIVFIFGTIILTFIEGIYKSSGLLFNCRDDNLLLSLPIKKSTVLFIRIFKFYVFELLYNTMFLLPAMVIYLRYSAPDFSYYFVSFLAIFLLPMIPVSLACIVGFVISSISVKFKNKNIIQIIVTMIFLLGLFFVSFNMNNLITKLVNNASSINSLIQKLYYPAGLYYNLVMNFNLKDFFVFLLIHIGSLALITIIFSRIYFNINSNSKTVILGSSKKTYKIKTRKQLNAIIRKELSKFTSSAVYFTNTWFGILLFVVGSIAIVLKYDSVSTSVASLTKTPISQLSVYVPVVVFSLIIFCSFMTSITSSMISLEGKSFNILKSLPVKPQKIIYSKVLTAVLLMVPFMLVGDIIILIKFNFNILETFIILVSSILLPIISETIGILVNLKFPKMNALNDTEVIKQSMSSFISVTSGMAIILISLVIMFNTINKNNVDLVLSLMLIAYFVMFGGLVIFIKKKGTKMFNDINV